MRGSKKRKRRSPGHGSLETLPSGKIRATVRHESQITKGPAVDPSDFESLVLAEAEAFKQLQAKLDSVSDDPSLPFSTYARNWLTRREDDDVSPTTLDTWGCWVRKLESDPLGAVPINQVTKEQHLDPWKRRQRNKRITVRKRLQWLHQLLAEAGNTARAELPKKEKSKRRPLSPDERTTLESKMGSIDDELYLMIHLTRGAMLRASDAAGLRHEDRDGDGVYINQVCVYTRKGLVVKPKPKSDNGQTWIPLSPTLQGLIGHGTGYVLGGKHPISPRRISRRVAHFARKVAGLKVPAMGPHALRRTGGMELLERGVDIVTAAEIMRHDKAVLWNEYAESRRDLKLQAMEKMYGKPVRSEDAK